MREFFKGWRRKVGCVTLVMAVGVATAWIRSGPISDRIGWWTERSDHQLYSSLGHFIWSSNHYDKPIDPRTRNPGSWRQYTGPNRPRVTDHTTNIGRKWSFSFSTFKFRKTLVNGITKYWLIIPYRLVAIPLTMLSAYLILWNPTTKTGIDAELPRR